MPSEERIIGRMLDVLEEVVVPLTRESVAKGNKVFGAAILRKGGLELVTPGVNGETENPLLHGEVSCLNNYWALPAAERSAPADCLFLSTHEPCSMCLSAITWSGFDSIFYLFSYEDTRDAFNIPHDLRIMDEVFGCSDGGYRKSNEFWTSRGLVPMIDGSGSKQAGRWKKRVEGLRREYARLSTAYQDSKEGGAIPLK